ncbi:MAG: hypothetical protein EBZ75_07510 [Oxalobacteraceae bacterium]|nr:hypothetical protein [Oxalobacteraceae bacterium]
MARLALLLITLYLNNAYAQTPAPAPAAAAPANPSATPPANAAAPASPAPKADPKAEPQKTQNTPAEPAPAPAPTPAPKPGRKGKEEPPPPPPVKTGPFKAPNCAVAEFRAIGIDTPDERTRRTKAIAWLKKKAPDCTAEQLIVMRNNREQWLGSADSATIAAMIDGLLESFAETNREVSILLYGTPPPPPKPDEKNAAKGAEKK